MAQLDWCTEHVADAVFKVLARKYGRVREVCLSGVVTASIEWDTGSVECDGATRYAAANALLRAMLTGVGGRRYGDAV